MHSQEMYYSQTGPGDLSTWATTEEGTQNYAEFQDNGSRDSPDFTRYAFAQGGHITPRGQGEDRTQAMEDFQSKWSAAAPAALGGEPMKRGSSRSSAGSHKHRTIKPSSSKGRARLASALSSKLPTMDITGNSSNFREGAQPNGPMDVNPMFLDTESAQAHLYYSGLPMDMTMTPDGLAFPSHDMSALHVVPSQMQLDPDQAFPGHSPTSSSWDAFSNADSQVSSPEGTWSLPAQSPESHNSSPVINGQSPSMRLGTQAMMSTEDLTGSAVTIGGAADDFALPPSFSNRRQSNEGESARDHFLYKNATPKSDGLYHCPWEGETYCNHRPEKLKCNYDKFVDSHLKPYRCKVESCLDARFSSTACLLRHEREAHAMHGHGDKPFLCSYDGCDRAQPGSGFPRQWNLKDHMRRVHNDNGVPTSAGSPPPTTAAVVPAQPPVASKAAKGRKRKTEAPEPSGRKASIKSMSGAESAKAVDRSPRDQWYEKKASLEELWRGLQPEDNQSWIQAKEMIATMEKISTGFGTSQKHNSIPPTYRRTYSSG